MNSYLLQLLCLLLAPLALAQSTEYITDGDFKGVFRGYKSQHNFDAGDWSFRDSATISGAKYYSLWFYSGSTPDRNGYANQSISGLDVGSTYTLNYIYQVQDAPRRPCTLRLTLASQVLDTVITPTRVQTSLPRVTRTVPFTAAESGGDFEIYFACPPKGEFQFIVDNVSLMGPN